MKAAVLRGNPNCPNLVATSVYDTKPVHFLSMVCQSIKWVVLTRLVFNLETMKEEKMLFLCLNLNDDYNNSMGHVDVSDQLRNQYRMDHWLRMRKWWWSLFMWGFGVLLTNLYICYTKEMTRAGKGKKDMLSHYDFRAAIARAWLDPSRHWPNHDVVVGGGSAKKRKRAMDEAAAPAAATQESRHQTRAEAVEAATAEAKAADMIVANRFLDRTLLPGGKLELCCTTNTVEHWPLPRDGNLRCAMHRWAGQTDKKLHLMWCQHCQVVLCIGCFKPFHTERNLLMRKQYYIKKFREEKRGKERRVSMLAVERGNGSATKNKK